MRGGSAPLTLVSLGRWASTCSCRPFSPHANPYIIACGLLPRRELRGTEPYNDDMIELLGVLASVAGAVFAYFQLRRTPQPPKSLNSVPDGKSITAENQSSEVLHTTNSQQSSVPQYDGEGINMVTTPQSLLEPYFPAARKLLGVVPRPGFHFLIVSGCSSAGKDVLVAETLRRVGTKAEMLRKYMTRGRRPGEADYSTSLSVSQFEKAEKAGKVLFPYHKRDCDYGFDTDDFLSAVKHGVCKIAVFTELSAVPKIVAALRANGFFASAVFIEVERPYLVRRSYHRNFGSNEVQKRLESVDQDLNTLSARTTALEREYYVVRNNEGEPFNVAKENMEKLVRRAIAGELPWPPA